MRPIQIPPVPEARRRTAVATPRAKPDHGGWVAAVDAFVFTIYRTGFVQSLILHVTVLLVLALIIIVPDLRPAATISLQFSPATPEVAPDLAAVELPALEVEPAETAAAPEPLPHMEAAAVEVELTGIDAVDPAVFTLEDAVSGIDTTGLLVDVPTPTGRGAVRADDPGAAEIGGEIGRRLKVAGAGTGDVQISIAWNNVNDIDLHVHVEPFDGRLAPSTINFINRVGVAGGCLDVDRNVRPTTRAPVENVFWGRGQAPAGRYTVGIHHFQDWGGGNPTEVEIVVLVGGEQKRFYEVLRTGDPVKVVTSFVHRPQAGGGPEVAASPRPPVRRPRPANQGYGPPTPPFRSRP